jgi:hypothetical protein
MQRSTERTAPENKNPPKQHNAGSKQETKRSQAKPGENA